MIDQFLDGTASVVCHCVARNYRNNFVVVACAGIAPRIKERERSPDKALITLEPLMRCPSFVLRGMTQTPRPSLTKEGLD